MSRAPNARSGPALPPELAAFARTVTERRLPNGLTVLLARRPGLATVHFAMAFGAGGVDEDVGRSGAAHLYEHMAFKGTATVGTRSWSRERPILAQLDALDAAIMAERAKGLASSTSELETLRKKFKNLEAKAEALVHANEFDEVYARNGAKGLNAFTSKDGTAYIIALPANRIRLWTEMESQRVKAPVLRQFYRERDVVIEELRRYDDVPTWRLYDALAALAYPAHPYRTPIIGWLSDLERLTKRDLEDFYRSRYRPDRACIAAVGDVPDAVMLREITRAFGSWRAPVPPPRPLTTEEPVQRGERRAVETMQANPLLAAAWPVPTWGHPDKAAVDVLSAVLGRGESSRLHTALVKRRQVAIVAQAFTEFPGQRYPNLLTVVVAPRAPHGPADCETALNEEITRLLADGVTDREVAKAVNLLESARFQELTDNTYLAATLATNQSTLGDWRAPLTWVADLRRVTAADVARVAKATLVPDRRNVVTVKPADPAAAAPAGGPFMPVHQDA